MKKLLSLSIFLTVFMLVGISQPTVDKRDTDQKYIDANTTGIKIFNNNELLKERIINIIKTKEYTYRTTYGDSIRPHNESYSQVLDLSIHQNKIIYLMLISLKDTMFLNRIGEIIKEDVNDIYSESGGIIKFEKNRKIYLKNIKSTAEFKHDEIFNNTYYLPEKEDSVSKIAYFHLHATTYNETPYAGPSSLDLMHASFLHHSNMTNEFLITSLKKGKFNIDYYGMDIRAGETGLLYEGDDIKIIDLGNYCYK
jgi:hypothetical protein